MPNITAQSDQCSGSTTISTSAQASAISSCGNYNGSITIDPTAAGTLNFTGLEFLQGNFTAQDNPNLAGLLFDSLEVGEFVLSNLSLLSTLNLTWNHSSTLPPLSSLNANLVRLHQLPSLQTVNNADAALDVSSLTVTYTALRDIQGEILVDSTIDVSYNTQLQNLNSFRAQPLTSGIIASNGENFSLSFYDYSNISSTLTISNVSNLSIPLQIIEGSFNLSSNLFDSLDLGSLQNVSGSLSISNNAQLQNLTFSDLFNISGELQVQNNTALNYIGLGNLTMISGEVFLDGTFNSVSAPALTNMTGELIVQTTSSNNSICTSLQNRGSGLFNCTLNVPIAKTGDGQSSSNAGSNGNGNGNRNRNHKKGLSGGEIAGIVIGCVVGLSLMAVLVWFTIRRKKLNNDTRQKDVIPAPLAGHHELPRGQHHEKAELYVDPKDVNEIRGQEIKGIPGTHEAPHTPVHMADPQPTQHGTDNDQMNYHATDYGFGPNHVNTMSHQEALEGFGQVDSEYRNFHR